LAQCFTGRRCFAFHELLGPLVDKVESQPLVPWSSDSRLSAGFRSIGIGYGTMVMVPKTSLLSLEAWLPTIIV
jgi:hypothetical protein